MDALKAHPYQLAGLIALALLGVHYVRNHKGQFTIPQFTQTTKAALAGQEASNAYVSGDMLQNSLDNLHSVISDEIEQAINNDLYSYGPSLPGTGY